MTDSAPARRFTLIGSISLLTLTSLAAGALTCFSVNDLTDNFYNLGVIRRSASPEAQSLLETSYKHWYFPGRDRVVGPEPWHHNFALYAQTLSYRATGRLIVPAALYMVMMLAFGALTLRLCRRLLPGGGAMALGAASAALLLASRTGVQIASAPWMDDLWAWVFVMGAFVLLAEPRWTIARCAGAGALCALAYSFKDFALIWAPIGAAIILGRRLVMREADQRTVLWLGAFAVGFAVFVTPRCGFNQADLGRFMADEARQALNMRRVIGVPDNEHWFYWIDPAAAEHQQGRVAGMPLATARLIKAVLLEPLFAVSILTVAGALLFLRGARDRADQLLHLMFWIGLGGYVAFFALQFGEAGQQRYWLPLIALGLVLALRWVWRGYGGEDDVKQRRWRRAFGGLMILGAAGSMIMAALTLRQVTTDPVKPPFARAAIAAIDQVAPPPGRRLLVNTGRGVLLYAERPTWEYVSVKYPNVAVLSEDQFNQLLTRYRVEIAAIGDEPTIQRLRQRGWDTIYRDDDTTVLAAPRLAPPDMIRDSPD